ncbi:hypothetical protein Tco_0005575 [Tanacetum coccineum]
MFVGYMIASGSLEANVILTTQPSPNVSTQGTHRKPSTHRTPNPKRIQNKNREQASGESSATLPKLKFKIQPQQPNPLIPVPTYTEIERDQLTKAQQVSLAKAESDKEDEARDNIKLVKEYVLAEEVDKLESLEEGKEEDDDYVDISLTRKKWTHNLEIREEQKQTPFTPPPRSPKIGLSLEKALTIKLSKEPIPMSDVPSHSSSHQTKHLRGVVARVTKRINKIFKTMKKNFVHRNEAQNLCIEIRDTFEKEVFPLTHVVTFKLPASTSIHALQERLCKAIKNRPYAQTTNPDIWAALKEIDDDEIISEEASPKFLVELKSLEQAKNYIENQIVWESREEELILQDPDMEALHGNSETKKYVLSMHKFHANPFLKDDLEELLTRLVKNKQGYGQDFMEKIVVKRADGVTPPKSDSSGR